MKNRLSPLLLVTVIFGSLSAVYSYGDQAEHWKGAPVPYELGVSAAPGLAIIDGNAYFGLYGSISKALLKEGWIEDINDSVHMEVSMGPAFHSGYTSLSYSLHGRWDFQYDEQWTPYALAGLGGHVTSKHLGDRFELFPRVALGTFFFPKPQFGLRGEISHEWISVGFAARF